MTEVKSELEFEHFLEFFKKQEERKTSSPSRRNFGHMKACAMDKDIANVLFIIPNLAHLNNISLEWWKIVNDLLRRKINGWIKYMKE